MGAELWAEQYPRHSAPSPGSVGQRTEQSAVTVGNLALSLGERVSGDGAFSSRRRTGEGFLPFANHLVRLRLRVSYSLPLPVRPAPCGTTKPNRAVTY